jgi:hypothetical protein
MLSYIFSVCLTNHYLNNTCRTTITPLFRPKRIGHAQSRTGPLPPLSLPPSRAQPLKVCLVLIAGSLGSLAHLDLGASKGDTAHWFAGRLARRTDVCYGCQIPGQLSPVGQCRGGMDSAWDIESECLAARPRALDLFDERFGGMTGMCRWGLEGRYEGGERWKGRLMDGRR